MKSEPSPCRCVIHRFTASGAFCWTSQWTTGTPVAGTSLALATVGWVGTHMWRSDQGLCCFHSSQGRSRCTTAAVLVPDFSGTALTISGGFVNTAPEGHQGWFPAFPWLRQGQGQCQKQCTLWACAMGDRQHHRMHSSVESRGLLSGSSHKRSAPIPPTSHHSSGMDLETSTPTTKEQTLPLAGLWQQQSKEEAPFSIQCRLW